MMSDKKPKVGIKIEEQEERPYDLMRVTLPVPRLFRLPKETRQHLRAARRERLLALRDMVDSAIERIEEKEQPSHKAEKVEIK
jgi:hypothetical protein